MPSAVKRNLRTVSYSSWGLEGKSSKSNWEAGLKEGVRVFLCQCTHSHHEIFCWRCRFSASFIFFGVWEKMWVSSETTVLLLLGIGHTHTHTTHKTHRTNNACYLAHSPSFDKLQGCSHRQRRTKTCVGSRRDIWAILVNSVAWVISAKPYQEVQARTDGGSFLSLWVVLTLLAFLVVMLRWVGRVKNKLRSSRWTLSLALAMCM